MKISILLVLFYLMSVCSLKAQSTSVLLTMDDSSTVSDNYKSDSKKAFEIASGILSSKEFGDAIKNLSFIYRNHCHGCKPMLLYLGNKKIGGQAVLDSLYKNATASMRLMLDSGTCEGSLGQTCPLSNNQQHETTSYYNALACDMPELSFSYRLAVNICHEYMHFIGFCHPNPIDKAPDKDHPAPKAFRDDIAYNVGWEAYYIAKDWQRTGRYH